MAIGTNWTRKTYSFVVKKYVTTTEKVTFQSQKQTAHPVFGNTGTLQVTLLQDVRTTKLCTSPVRAFLLFPAYRQHRSHQRPARLGRKQWAKSDRTGISNSTQQVEETLLPWLYLKNRSSATYSTILKHLISPTMHDDSIQPVVKFTSIVTLHWFSRRFVTSTNTHKQKKF